MPNDNECVLSNTKAWFEQAVPTPSSKQVHTQIGVHFEEVGEMLTELLAIDLATDALLINAQLAITALSKHLKSSDNVIMVPASRREKFLDALCDQLVTATGVGHVLGLQIVGALQEVNDSNWSKFVGGVPVFDANMKIQKGPEYFKAKLTKFIPA